MKKRAGGNRCLKPAPPGRDCENEKQLKTILSLIGRRQRNHFPSDWPNGQAKQPTKNNEFNQKAAPDLVLRFIHFSFRVLRDFALKASFTSWLGKVPCQRCSFTVFRIFYSF